MEFEQQASQGRVFAPNREYPLALVDLTQLPQNAENPLVDTYFQAAALALFGDISRADEMRKAVLFHFANILFGNQHHVTILKGFKTATARLQVSKKCTQFPAIRQWVYRMHLAEQQLHASVDDWLKVYPNLLKDRGVRFIEYNRKRTRISCKFTFAYLLADVYQCKVMYFQYISGENYVSETEWMLPASMVAESGSMEIDEDGNMHPVIESYKPTLTSVIMYHTPLKVYKALLPWKTAEKLGVMQTIDTNITPEKKYQLRQFFVENQDARNIPVGDFVQKDEYCFCFDFTTHNITSNDKRIYQVFPGGRLDTTSLYIPLDEFLYIFKVTPTAGLEYTGTCTQIADIYPCFKLKNNAVQVWVVLAETLEKATQLLGRFF